MECSACGYPLVEGAAFCPRCETPIEGAPECTDYVYEAFISYRHLPLDRTAALRIQKAIEGFRIPKQLQEAAGRERLGKCFRDEDELPTSASLSEQIEHALLHTRYLIVVCSTHTRESLWVQREVELFSAYHGRSKVLLALVEGEPEESFPALLLTKMQRTADGAMEEIPSEPLAADFRDLRRAKFNVEKLRPIATLIGCNFDDLRQRAKLRRNKLIAGIATGVAAVSLAFGGFATYQQIQINESYKQIQLEESEFLATEANTLLAQGDRFQAVQVALAGLPESSASADRPFAPAAQMELGQSLGVYPGETDWASQYSQIGLSHRYDKGAAYNEDNTLAAVVASDRWIEIRETLTNNMVCRFDAETPLGYQAWTTSALVGMCFAGNDLVVAYRDGIGCFDAADGSTRWALPLQGIGYDNSEIAVSPDHVHVAVTALPDFGKETVSVHLIDLQEGKVQRSFALPGYAQMGMASRLESMENRAAAFSPDGSRLVVGVWGSLFVIDLETGEVGQTELGCPYVRSVRFMGDYLAVVSENTEGSLFHIPTSLEVFDGSPEALSAADALEPLWRREETIDVGVTSAADPYPYEVGIFGTWSYAGEGDEQLVALFGSKLLLIDVATGEEVWSLASGSSFADCLVADAYGTPHIFAMMGDSTLICRIPHASNSGEGNTIADTNLGYGILNHGDLVEIGGRVYSFMWTSNPDKYRVHRFAESTDMPQSRLFEIKEIDPQLSTIMWNQATVVVLTKGGFVFADPNTFEPQTEVPLSALSALDVEKQSSFEYAIGFDGNLYVIGQMAKEANSVETRHALYRVNRDDGSADLLLAFDRGMWLYQFRMLRGADGNQLVLLTGTVSSADGVVIADLNKPAEQAKIVDIKVPGARKAWYSGDRVIVCYSDGSHVEGRFALIDAESGEELESDIAHCMLSSSAHSDTLAASSPDGKTLAVACSDGYLRLFDLHEGSLIWETAQASAVPRFISIGTDGNIFVQDGFGLCLLVSGKTGDVLKASSTPLPPISQATLRADGNALVASFSNAGMYGSYGIVAISLDEDAFGPLDIMYGGYCISADGKLYAYRDSYTKPLRIAQRLSLDELIVAGKELVAGHELTESEKHLYQVGE